MSDSHFHSEKSVTGNINIQDGEPVLAITEDFTTYLLNRDNMLIIAPEEALAITVEVLRMFAKRTHSPETRDNMAWTYGYVSSHMTGVKK
jgi:hypothetical protein